MQARFSSLLTSGLAAALALGSTGCAQIVVGVWLATSDGGGSSSSGGGGGSATPSQTLEVALSPARGPALGGNEVQVRVLTPGVTFPAQAGGVTVEFRGGVGSATVRVVDATTVACQVPPHVRSNRSGEYEVRVTVAGTRLQASARYAYEAEPHQVTGISPTTGTTAGNTTVALQGYGLVEGMSVRFGSVAGSDLTALTGHQQGETITRPSAPGAVDVVVTHPEGFSVTLPGAFTYSAALTTPGAPGPQLPSFPASNVTFALVTGEPAIHQAALSGTLSAAKVADLPAGSDPWGIVAESGDVLVVLDGAGQRLLRFSRTTRQVIATPVLDVAPTAQRRGLVRLNRQGEVVGVLPGMQLRHVSLDRGQTHAFSTLGGAARVEALAADPWGTIWAAGSPGDDDQAERLYRVDLETGVLTDVGPFGVDLDHLTWGSDGVLYGLQAPAGANAMLYRVDPRSGAATFMEDTRVSDVRGFVQVAGIFNHRGPLTPWVRSTVPETVLAGTTTEVILVGEGLGSGTTITTTATGTRIVSDRTGPDDQRVLSVRYDGGSPTPELQFYTANAHGDSRFTLRGRPSNNPVFIGAGEVVRFAGAFRCQSLTIQAGGTLRGVGLQPLVVFSSGPVQIDGTLDLSGHTGSVPRVPMGTGTNGASSDTYSCGHGGDGGPGGGGGGGGGAAERAILTQGGEGGWGYSGGGGGGGSTDRRSGRGGLGAGGFGAPAATATAGFGDGGDGGSTPQSGPGGLGGFGGGGGGTGSQQGMGGEGGPTSGQTLQIGSGGGAGGQQSSDGTGGGGGSHATPGENGRLSGGSSSGGGPAGFVHGSPDLIPLGGGSGGGGGSGRGAFNGLAAGGGGGGGALVLAALGTITVGATGAILADGGDGGRHPNSDGEGGAGSGGALLIQAPTVSLTTGARLEARGGQRPSSSGNYRGAGGDGRIRVDAPALLIDAGAVSEATFAAATAPAAGFFGAAVPTVAVTTPPDSVERLTLSYTVTDADANRVFIEVQVSENGGPFRAATPHTDSAPTFAVPASPGGQAHTFLWAANADLAPGTSSVVLRVRAIDARVGPWATTGAFNVTSS